MKTLFGVGAIVLILLAVMTYFSFPDQRSPVPVLYWVTDSNPARDAQIEGFEKWLVDNGHTTAAGLPVCYMRTDTTNNDTSKKIIQGVSAVGGDVWDVFNGTELRYLHAIGLLTDVTEDGKKLGFDTSHTWAAITPEITVDGRQFAFPCNVTSNQLWVNLDVFKKAGMEPPPRTWTFDEFEATGKQLVDRLNKPGARERVFFCMPLDLKVLLRSEGLSIFNETLTKCTLDDPRFVDVLQRYYKWTYKDHILPSLADQQSFSTQQGYGGPTLQLFNRGQIAMFQMGRYALIQLRKFNQDRKAAGEDYLHMAISMPPYAQFPNTSIGTRCAVVYVAGHHKDLAKLFLAYLASDAYSTQIVNDADALPPSPAITKTEAFIHPPDHPEEWGLHEPFADAARTLAIANAYSPYVLDSIVQREFTNARDGYMADQLTAEEAAHQAAERIDAEIERTLQEQPNLRPHYEELLKRQKEIDAKRAANEPVPLDWIDNPFYRRYYQAKGWTRP